MKHLYLLIVVLSVSLHMFSQNIKGKVEDSFKKPISNATIILLEEVDSSFVTATTSRNDGTFLLESNLTNKKLVLKISFLGYETVTKTVCGNDLGTIILKEDSQSLNGITIVANRIVNSANGYALQLQGTGLENCNTAQDLFAFLPGLSVENKKINLLGKQPIIYVNGIKITSQDELNALAPKRIAKIEVNYLAVGEGANETGGTIKIVTKRMSDGGFSGYLQENITEMPKYGHTNDSPTFVFDTSIGRMTLNYYAIYSHQKLLEDARNEYKYDDGDAVSYSSRTRSWSNTFANRLNLSYELNDNSIIALSEYIGSNDVKNRQYSDNVFISGPFHKFVQQTVAKYTLTTDDKGSNYEVTADYLNNKQHQTQNETVYDENVSCSHVKQNTNMYRIQQKYIRKSGNGSELNFGVDYQYIHGLDETEAQQNTMKGHSPSSYINYSGSIKNMMYAIGLTWQYNYMKVNSNGESSTYSDNYFCPQANLMWVANPKKGTMLALMYQRSVENMPYSIISAYRNYSTPNHYTTGNTSLRTPNEHQMILRFSYDKHLAFTFMFARIEDDIYFAHGIDAEQPSVTWSKPMNANYNQATAARIEYTCDLAKWWKTKMQTAILQLRFSSPEETVTGKCCGKFWFNNNFNFSETFGASLNIYWETGTSFENYNWRPVGNVAMSLWKTACKEKLRFAFDSTIWAKGRKKMTMGEGYTSYYNNITGPTSFDFTITWNFSGGKQVKRRSEAEGIQEYHRITEKK